MRVYTATVPEKPTEKTIEAYLGHALPLLPQFALRDAFSRRDVKMNGIRVQPDLCPVPGAAVQVFTDWEAKLPIVFEDEHVLLVNKPGGISCDDDGRGGMTIQGLLGEQTHLCHRLDNQTCGLLIAAKDKEAEDCLLQAFREHTLTKRYECMVKGLLRPPQQTVHAHILKDTKAGRMRVVSHATPDTKPIATQYETLAAEGTVSRLRVTLLTGRTHQIRAQMAALQHPILGDDVYGDRPFNQRMHARRLMLCSTELTLNAGGILSYLDGRHFSVKAPF